MRSLGKPKFLNGQKNGHNCLYLALFSVCSHVDLHNGHVNFCLPKLHVIDTTGLTIVTCKGDKKEAEKPHEIYYTYVRVRDRHCPM